MKKIAVIAVLSAFAVAAVLVVRAMPPVQTRDRVTDIDPKKLFKPRLGAAIPTEATFRDETGKTVQLGSYGNTRPYILVPAYFRCPSLCNEVLNELVKGLRGIASYQVGRDFDVVVVSFDAREQPALARAKKVSYVEEYARGDSASGWHFLTGEQAEINRVLDAIGYKVEWDESKQQFLHAAGIVICTPGGSIARYFPGLDYRPLYLRLALTEAGQGTISAGLIDQVLLPCFAFDETKGLYTAAVLTLVRAGGVVTLLGVLTLWVVMSRRRRPGTNPTGLGAATLALTAGAEE